MWNRLKAVEGFLGDCAPSKPLVYWSRITHELSVALTFDKSREDGGGSMVGRVGTTSPALCKSLIRMVNAVSEFAESGGKLGACAPVSH